MGESPPNRYGINGQPNPSPETQTCITMQKTEFRCGMFLLLIVDDPYPIVSEWERSHWFGRR